MNLMHRIRLIMLLSSVWLCLFTLLSLAGCASKNKDPLYPKNVATNFYSHSLSAVTIPVTLQKILPATRTKPERFIYRIPNPVYYEGSMLIPAGSNFAAVVYYRDTPHIVIEQFRKAGYNTWTPAQGVISKTSPDTGVATLSHITVL